MRQAFTHSTMDANANSVNLFFFLSDVTKVISWYMVHITAHCVPCDVHYQSIMNMQLDNYQILIGFRWKIMVVKLIHRRFEARKIYKNLLEEPSL